MSSTSQVTTFSDLYTDLLNRVRISTSQTDSVTQAKRYINIALQDIHLGFDYKLPWCERQFVLRTKAPYTTGGISINVGSGTLGGIGTAWNTVNSYGETNMVAGGKVIASGETNVYKISTVTSDVSAALTTRYVGSANLSNAEYTYFEDEYSLATTFLRPLDFQMFSPQMNISLISRNEFRRRFPVVNVSGRPRVACIIDSPTTGADLTPIRKVVFYPYPDQAYNIPYTYITANIAVTSAGAGLTSMSSDTDTPAMPLRYRHAIVLHALAHWYRDRKDDARSELARQEYVDIMSRIVGDHDFATHTTARMTPSGGRYAQYASTPYSNRGGKKIYDLNDEFDSFRR